MTCPRCQEADEPRPISFTWWGGVLGPKLLHHVACPRCGARFNGKSGRSNSVAIGIYLIAVGSVATALMLAVLRL